MDAKTLNNLGTAEQVKGDWEAARLYYLAALRLEPGYVPALVNLSVAYSNQNNLLAARTLLRKLVAIIPGDGNIWNNLGNVLMRLEEYDESELALDTASTLAPDNPAVWHNLGLLLGRMRLWDDALDAFDRVQALGNSSHAVLSDRAHILLGKGDLPTAFEPYESRWAILPHQPPWDFHIPEWQGQDLKGKSLLFHAEQGFGDSLMCCRFVSHLRDLGAYVTVGVPPALVELMEAQSWCSIALDITRMTDADAKHFDYHTPMYSAMRWLGITEGHINGAPYIKVPERVVSPLHRGVMNVGICWASGKRGGEHDWRRRYAPLNKWLPLAELPAVQLWSLQKGDGEDDIHTLGLEALVEDRTRDFRDWADTAAFIAGLDMVVSVDTAVAHLSAAMGIPTIMLSQYTCCWRWWNIDSENGRPWYDCMTIFRQPDPTDWNVPIMMAKTRILTALRTGLVSRREAA